MQIIARGAEAVLSRSGSTITKERIKKGYRLEQIDTLLRKKRNRTEAALLREARRAGVNVPQVIEEKEFSMRIELIEGDKVRDAINGENCEEIARKIGESAAKLHGHGIIHGDLTTSNMVLRDKQIYLIDFGLGFFSGKNEDKATDLHLLHQALESTHFSILERTWTTILSAYGEGGKVIKTLAEIEKRGRYKER